ncbi:MAG TPA: hypothetical protein VGH24_04090 [Solirubrobacteraceae bacterium]
MAGAGGDDATVCCCGSAGTAGLAGRHGAVTAAVTAAVDAVVTATVRAEADAALAEAAAEAEPRSTTAASRAVGRAMRPVELPLDGREGRARIAPPRYPRLATAAS